MNKIFNIKMNTTIPATMTYTMNIYNHPHNGSNHYEMLNKSSTCTGIQCYSPTILVVATAFTIVLAVFGFVGNVLTVLAILTSRLRTNINSILIGNLSFVDAIYCGVVLPLQASAFYNNGWILSETVCQLQAALRYWMIGVNMMLLSCIALYRLLYIVYRQGQSCVFERPCFLFAIMICWAFPAIFSFSPLLKLWGNFSFQSAILQCTFDAGSDKAHKITTITLGFVVPCLFICFCYFRIAIIVAGTRRRASRSSINRRQRAKRESFRLTAMMILIFLGFLLGTTPYFIINASDSRVRYPLPHIWAPFLAWFMYGLNPIIYTVMDAQFQEAYKRLIMCFIFKKSKIQRGSFHERQSSIIKETTHHTTPQKLHINPNPPSPCTSPCAINNPLLISDI